MRIVLSSSFVLSIFALWLPMAAHAVTWPNNVVRENDIVINFEGNYEPSGLVWNSQSNKLFTVSDDGKVTRMELDGSNQETDTPRAAGIGTDFEAITIINPSTNKLYIGLEHPDSILEYDWVTKNFAEKRWDLTQILTGPNNEGLEGLTFVPNNYLPATMDPSASGGLFYAAVQRRPIVGGNLVDDYLIYAFDIDLSTSGRIVRWWGIPVAPNTPLNDISDLSFNKDTGLLYVLYDGANRLIEMKPDGTVVSDYSNVPVADQEGVAVITHYPSRTATIYFASDSQKHIGWFSGYPAAYYDADNDGVDYIVDCNDRDSSISENQIYYRDGDGDGLGSDEVGIFCALVAPDGYVSNSDDPDDTHPAQENNSNLIIDGGMEVDGTINWINWSTPLIKEKSVDDVFEGNHSLYLNSLDRGAGFQQRHIPVEPGKSYRLSFHYKLLSGTMRTLLGINGSNADFANRLGVRNPNNSWEVFIRDFTVPANFQGDFRFVVSIRYGEGYFDAISIEEIETPSLIADGDMEALGKSQWQPYGTPNELIKTRDTASSGVQSLYVDSRGIGSGTSQSSIAIQPGKTYILTMRYKFRSDGNRGSRIRPILNIPDINKNGDFEGIYRNLPRGDAEWLLYERTFTVPENAAKDLRIFLTMRYGEGWIDDVTVQETVLE